MVSDIYIQRYSDFPYNEREIIRYSCMSGADNEDMIGIMHECMNEVISQKICTYNICYRVVPIKECYENGDIDFELLRVNSKDLYSCIKGCNKAIFMAATIGHGMDRIIRRYATTSPAKSLFFQAIGAERVETMLDYFCSHVDYELTPRFSPGYGDLSLTVQPDFLATLDCSRKLGITINDSLLMAPSKSVTAIAGIK